MTFSQTATSSQASSSSHGNQHTPQPLSRLARFGAGLGFGPKSSSNLNTNASNSSKLVYNEANESDWYIPYNGPYEVPPKDVVIGVGAEEGLSAGKGKGKRREVRDSWTDFLTNLQQADPFARDGNVSQTQIEGVGVTNGNGNMGGRTRGQRSGSLQQEDERGRTRSRAFSGSSGSKYPTDSSVLSPTSPLSPRPRGHTFGLGSSHTHARAPVPSFVGDVGIGDTPVPVQRYNAQALSHGHGGHGLLNSLGHNHGYDRSPHAHFALDSTTELHDRQPHTANPVLQNPRASHSSFWTFGGGGSRKSAPSLYSGGSVSVKDKDREKDRDTTRPSADTFFTGGRPSTSTYQTYGTAGRQPQGQNTAPVRRDRSATFGDGTIPSGLGANPPTVRPRANTALSPTTAPPNAYVFPPVRAPQSNMSSNAKGKQRADVDRARDYGTDTFTGGPGSDQSHSTFSYHNHPYAVTYPSSGHREHSRFLQPKKPIINLVPFLSPSKSHLPDHLRNSSSKMLKASVSTPNLRGAANSGAKGTGGRGFGPGASLGVGLNGRGSPRAPGSGYSSPSATGSPKWLSAETWCDALIFPRPRFRMRGTAHIISPPASPTKNFAGTGTGTGTGYASGDSPTPPNTAPLKRGATKKSQTQVQPPEVQERKWPLLAPPTSDPPLFLPSSQSQPRGGPATSEFGGEPEKQQQKGSPSKGKSKELRPPRPKSFAMDDLALPSPVPSLAR